MKPIEEVDVTDKTVEEVCSIKEWYDRAGFSTSVQVYEGLVDTYILEVEE